MIEFGLVGRTMHKVDERAPLADIEGLARIYEAMLDRFFAAAAAPAPAPARADASGG